MCPEMLKIVSIFQSIPDFFMSEHELGQFTG